MFGWLFKKTYVSKTLFFKKKNVSSVMFQKHMFLKQKHKNKKK